MTYQKNAVDLLIEVMKTRNWHQGKIEARKAAGYKVLARKGKVSYGLAVSILELLGYKKQAEEVWEKE